MTSTDPSSREDERERGLFQIRRLARQSTLLLTSGTVSYAGALILNVLLARTLGESGFGAWVIAFSMAATLAPIGLLGADWIVLRYGSHFEGIKDEARLRRTIHIALMIGGGTLVTVAVALFVLAPTLATALFENASVAPLLRLTAVMVPVIGVEQIMLNGTRAYKSVRELVLINNIMQPTCRLLVVGVALLVNPTPFSAFVGLLAAEVILALSATFALNRRVSLLGPTEWVSIREMLRFGLPAWGTRVVENSRTQLFPVMLGSLVDFSASGAYVAGKRVAQAPSSVTNSLIRVYSPIASDLYLQDKHQELNLLFKNLAKWSFALAFPLFCFVVAFPSDILALFGAGFRDESPTLVVLAFAMLFNFGTGPVTITLVLSGRPRLALIDYVVVVILEFALGFWLIPSIGVLGAAIAKLVGTATNNVVPLLQVWRLEGLLPYRFDYWKPLVAGVGSAVLAKGLMSAVSIGGGFAAVAAAAVVVGCLYTGMILLFGLSEEDRTALQTLLRRVRPSREVEEPETDVV